MAARESYDKPSRTSEVRTHDTPLLCLFSGSSKKSYCDLILQIHTFAICICDYRSGQSGCERANGEGDGDGVRGPGEGAAGGAAEREEGGVLAERRHVAVVHVPPELLPRRLVPPRQLQLPPARVQRRRPPRPHARARPRRRARRQHVQRRRRRRRLPDHVTHARADVAAVALLVLVSVFSFRIILSWARRNGSRVDPNGGPCVPSSFWF